MAETLKFTAATVEDAITNATTELGITSDQLSYTVLEKGSKGFLGIGSKEAVIEVTVAGKVQEKFEKKAEKVQEKVEEKIEKKAEKFEKIEKKAEKVKTSENDKAHFEEGKKFLEDVFEKMGMKVTVEYEQTDEDTLEINLTGDEMGVLIGKRGQTLDSLQYLTSLVVNRSGEHYIRVKLDTENYRERRKETLESLAKNIAYKVKRTRKSVSLEPMNPYERRIIHSVLQSDNFVMTRSEGEEPYRHVVVFYRRNKNGEER
ncbi:MAG: protein jag [Lachnospiraceae bacterium]|nr:protein jag [Lachnospiraceae bacterium]